MKLQAEILIAEDDPVNYFLMKEFVSLFGASYVWAKNGQEVLDILESNNNISLILMDINMPKMDGITTTKKIRERNIQIPIIFQTAFDNDDNIRKCINAGGNEFITKPINKEKLYSLLKKYS